MPEVLQCQVFNPKVLLDVHTSGEHSPFVQVPGLCSVDTLIKTFPELPHVYAFLPAL